MNKKQKDPVCGMSINSKDCSFKVHHKDKQYSFCCQDCMKEFKNNPEKYTK